MGTDDARKLFVAGLPDSITEDVLRELFEATGGTVVSVSLPKDRMTGRPRGFGFITFSSAEQASSARDALDGSMQSGRAMSVRPFSSEPPKRGDSRPEPQSKDAGSDRTVYVGNLPFDISSQDVEALFADNGAGPVVRVHLPTGPEGRPRGFGFVTLGSSDAANQAISALRNLELNGRRLTINLAHARGERPQADRPFRGPRDSREPRESRDAPTPRPPMSAADLPAPGAVDFGESTKPLEGRRARARGTERDDSKRSKKRKKSSPERAQAAGRRERGGARNLKKLDWDDD